MTIESIIFCIGGALLVSPIVYVLWRNISLSQPWKAIYCLTFIPLFIVGIFVNFFVVDAFAPWLFEALREAKESHISGQRNPIETILGMITAVPIPIVLSFLWFYFLRAVDRATRSRD